MDPIFHEAADIRLDNPFDADQTQQWSATHRGCAGVLRLVDDWKCEACGSRFRDVHTEDVRFEAQRKEAREECARQWDNADAATCAKLEKALQKAYDKINPAHAKANKAHRTRTRAYADGIAKQAERDIKSALEDNNHHGVTFVAGVRKIHAAAYAKLPMSEHDGARARIDKSHEDAIAQHETARAEYVTTRIAAGEPEPEAPTVYDLILAGHEDEDARDLATEAAAVRDEYRRQAAALAAAPEIETPPAPAPEIVEEVVTVVEEEDPLLAEQLREHVAYLLDNDAAEPVVPTITEVTATGRDISQAEIIVADQKRLLAAYLKEKQRRHALELAKKPGSL